jgi:hypothetical protein
MALQMQMQTAIKLMDRSEDRAKLYSTGYDPENEFWIKFEEYQHEVEELQLLIKQFANPNYKEDDNSESGFMVKKRKGNDNEFYNPVENGKENIINIDTDANNCVGLPLGSTITIDENQKEYEDLSEWNNSNK